MVDPERSMERATAAGGPAPRGRPGSSCLLEIAGLRFALRSQPQGPPLWIPPATQRFALEPDGRAPDTEVTCRWGDLSGSGGRRLVFDSGGAWKLFENEAGDPVFRFEAPLLRPHPYKEAHFSRDFRRGEVMYHAPYFPEERPFYPLDPPLDELVMVHLLGAGRGVELHGCGLVDASGEGLLFLGAAGTGKSTTARLWLEGQGVRLLGDDRIVVRRDERDGRLWMHGTPWHGETELARPERAPLSALFLLRQAADNRLMPCRGGDLLARLTACAFPTFPAAGALATTFRFLRELAREVPCSLLDFRPDRAVVDFVRGARRA
jgi:hypothetical protein